MSVWLHLNWTHMAISMYRNVSAPKLVFQQNKAARCIQTQLSDPALIPQSD